MTKNPKTLPVIIFAHGFGGDKHQVEAYTNSTNNIFDTNLHNMVTFNFPEVPQEQPNRTKLDQTTFGQENDINMVHETCSTITKTANSDSVLIGFGVSRGASVWINYLGTTKNHANIKGLILESPFSSANKILENKNLFGEQTDLKTVLTFFPQYKPNGIQPINSINNVDPNIAILFIASKEDALVPINQTRELYIKRKQKDNKNTYFLELATGIHANVLWGKDGKLYQQVVHAFYHKLNLPCNQKLATQVNLELYQP